jgi:hypothetical protein
MVMSSKKISKMVDTDVDKALANIGANTPKLDMKADDTLKAAAPSRDMTRGEAFRYARMAAKAAGLDPSKQTFEYKGKTYNTRMAGEGVKRPAAPAAGRSGTGSSAVSRPSAPAAGKPATPAAGKPATPRANPLAAPTAGKDALAASIERRNKLVAPKKEPGYFERMATNIAARNKATMGKIEDARKAKAIAERGAKAKQEAAAKKRADDYRKANRGWEFGMKAPGKAAGGKIDGCAVRGKTRAMKKGK